MKKKILLVSDSLNMGGLEKCLINICNNLDYSKYEVDLYLFNEGRTLLDKLNKNVKLLPESPYYKDLYNTSVVQSVKTLVKKKKPLLALYRIVRFFRARIKDYSYTALDWSVMQRTMLKIHKKYDVAIGFAEGTSNYYVAECVDADVKNMWIHTDIKEISCNPILDNMAFEKANNICTVSQNSRKSFEELYPKFKDKIKVFTLPSLFDYDRIDTLADELNEMDKNAQCIVSVGRLVELKGFHLCVEPCKKLVDEGYNIKWYICGDGPQRDELEELISKYNLKKQFILLGSRENPYTYIKGSSICVQPSSYEGLSLVIYEEKYLKKPVICTGIKGNLEMISDNGNGLVIERNGDSIYEALKQLLDDPELLRRLGDTPAINFVEKQVTINNIEETFKYE